MVMILGRGGGFGIWSWFVMERIDIVDLPGNMSPNGCRPLFPQYA